MNGLRQFWSWSCLRQVPAIAGAACLLVLGSVDAQQPKGPPSKMPLPSADPPPKRIMTQGLARTVTEDLIPCAVNQPEVNVRKNPGGQIVAQDGKRLTVLHANDL